MSLATLIRSMTEAGAPPEAIALAVEAVETARDEGRDEGRKQYERERKAAYRASKIVPDLSGTIEGQAGDIPGQKVEPRARVVISNSPTENIIKNPPTEGKKPEPKSKPDRGHRLPADWRPSLDGQAFAADTFGIGWPVEFQKFQNHFAAASGASAVKRDWSAAWRNWVLRAAEYRPKTGPPRQRRPRFSDFIHEDFHERTRSTGPASNATSAHDAAGIRSTGLSAEPDSAGASGDVIDLRPSGAGWR